MANNEHPINGMMDTTLEKIRQMVDSNTIIGNPISTADGATILPVSRVSFGFASGGTDFANAKAPQKDLFGGGGGAGVSITPIAFLVISGGNVRMVQLADKYSTVDRALNMLPEIVDKVSDYVKGAKKGKDAPKPEQDKPEAPAAAPEADAQFIEEIIIEAKGTDK